MVKYEEVEKKMTYNKKQIKRKLENALRVFRIPKNSEIIDKMIDETLDKISFNIIADATMEELRNSFKFQNFTDWGNILKLDWNEKYY